jgi:MFS family permease
MFVNQVAVVQKGLFGLRDLATFAFGTLQGLFVGALVFSTIADRFGRRPIFTYSLVWYAVATLVMSGQSTALSVCLWRFIATMEVGAESIAVAQGPPPFSDLATGYLVFWKRGESR